MSPSYAKPTTPAETAASSPHIGDDAYRALEDIVGAGNVSRDAAVLDGYAFQWLAELVRPDQSHYMPRPAAVAPRVLHAPLHGGRAREPVAEPGLDPPHVGIPGVAVRRSLDRAEPEVIDAGGDWVLPGFVQTHVHLCQTVFRGLADDLPLPTASAVR